MDMTYKPKKLNPKKVTFKKGVKDRLAKKYKPKKVTFKKLKAKKCCMKK